MFCKEKTNIRHSFAALHYIAIAKIKTITTPNKEHQREACETTKAKYCRHIFENGTVL
jgi:hypothetical protein